VTEATGCGAPAQGSIPEYCIICGEKNPFVMPPHSRTRRPVVTVRPNLVVVAVVANPGNSVAQIQVVVTVVTRSKLRCHPRVSPGFGGFLDRCTDIFS
jgi:hypothetical protein